MDKRSSGARPLQGYGNAHFGLAQPRRNANPNILIRREERIHFYSEQRKRMLLLVSIRFGQHVADVRIAIEKTIQGGIRSIWGIRSI